MTTLGQLCLLTSFIASGYAAFACFVGSQRRRPGIERAGTIAGAVAVAAISAAAVILAIALLSKDFRFAYVTQYSSRLLAWQYALSAFWVGQAGSLLLWAWLVAIVAAAYRFWPRSEKGTFPNRSPTFAILMAYQCFLVAVMIFGCDPMQPSLAFARDGNGLSPEMQHPAMLLHPPIVFLGYAACAVPFALAAAALLCGEKTGTGSAEKGTGTFCRDQPSVGARPPGASHKMYLSPFPRGDAAWVREARPWVFFAWVVSGIGILVGAYWAYEELGWGGYWSWDPVENGSLMPWLLATALVHASMVYRRCGGLKRTTLALAVATFAACNFAAFLTRSGIFSSLHAFSQSPIGWMFLALIAALAAGTPVLLVRQRGDCPPVAGPISGLLAAEGVATLSVFALVLLAAAVFCGTVSLPLSQVFLRHPVFVGEGFYNGLLVPVGLLLSAAMAAAPLLRWGAPPDARRMKALAAAVGVGAAAGVVAWLDGLRHPLAIALVSLAIGAVAAMIASWVVDAWQIRTGTGASPAGEKRGQAPRRRRFSAWQTNVRRGASPLFSPILRTTTDLLRSLRGRRRTYAGYAMHLAIACLAVGVAGSSLASQQREATLNKGETVRWAGRNVRFVAVHQQRLPDKLVVQAELEVTAVGAAPYTLRPAQQYHFLPGKWNAEVAIHSDWSGDFYTILHSGEGQDRIQLTLRDNPLMRWMWLAGGIVVVGAVPWLWPTRNRAAKQAARPTVEYKKMERRRKAA